MNLAQIEGFDKDITLAINSLNTEWSDHLWMLMSDKNIWFLMYAAVAVMLFSRLGWKKALIAILACGLTIVCCDQIAGLVKHSVMRLRPCYDTYMLGGGLHMLDTRRDFYGFFSAHAANAFGFAVCSLMAFKANDKSSRHVLCSTGILLWASLVAISRVFVGKHFFGDILVGSIVGISIGFALACLANTLVKRINYIKQ